MSPQSKERSAPRVGAPRSPLLRALAPPRARLASTVIPTALALFVAASLSESVRGVEAASSESELVGRKSPRPTEYQVFAKSPDEERALLAQAPQREVPIGGTWRLVEQNYGEGGFNFAPRTGRYLLEFEMTERGMVGRVVVGEDAAPWPAFTTPEGFIPLAEVRAGFGPQLRRAAAEYIVPDPSSDARRLRVEETYRVDDEERLVGTFTVYVERDGAPAGSYTWQLVFERWQQP